MKPEIRNKIEKVSLRVFLFCMIFCAASMIFIFWFNFFIGEEAADQKLKILFVINATLFVIGLANFLIWLPVVIYRLLDSKK